MIPCSLVGGKKPFSRMLEITYKTAWHIGSTFRVEVPEDGGDTFH
jgi:hypothetical protein